MSVIERLKTSEKHASIEERGGMQINSYAAGKCAEVLIAVR
ncbi:hypothetical protein [Xanthomonas vesicatoria]|nr:hypothetical protein [Xanthomonas vesicatoria]